jgi:hypothetical protein
VICHPLTGGATLQPRRRDVKQQSLDQIPLRKRSDPIIGATFTATVRLDRPFFDPSPYGNGPNDSVTDHTETAAITHHVAMVGGKTIAYTATAGHS